MDGFVFMYIKWKPPEIVFYTTSNEYLQCNHSRSTGKKRYRAERTASVKIRIVEMRVSQHWSVYCLVDDCVRLNRLYRLTILTLGTLPLLEQLSLVNFTEYFPMKTLSFRFISKIFFPSIYHWTNKNLLANIHCHKVFFICEKKNHLHVEIFAPEKKAIQ